MNQNPQGVRRATPNDIDALMVFVPQVLQETSLLPLSSDKVGYWIERCCYRKSGAMAGIIDGQEGIDASIGFAFIESETSDIPYIFAIWNGLHPSIRKHPGSEDNPKAHYGRRLFEFSRWCHANLEAAAGHPILFRFDLLTLDALGPKMRLYQRNLTQVGASFAFGIPPKGFQQQNVALAAS